MGYRGSTKFSLKISVVNPILHAHSLASLFQRVFYDFAKYTLRVVYILIAC